MRLLNDALAAKLLEAAKTEFLTKGFRNASLRNIAASAGVTTGAIYRYYANKEALFDALVAEPAEAFFHEYQTYSKNFSSAELDRQLTTLPQLADKPNGKIAVLMTYIYEHYDAFKLIACCAAGTRYENYAERLTEIETASGMTLVHLLQKENRRRWIWTIRSFTTFPIRFLPAFLRSSRTMTNAADAQKHINALYDFYTAGWYEILGIK